MVGQVRGVAAIAVAVMVGAGLGAGVLAGQSKEVAASNGWVKLPAPGATTTTAFAEIVNPTAYDVYLTSAVADAADSVEFREMGPGGVAKPGALKFITVPAYGSTSLQADGVHLLLTTLKRPLKEGDSVSITLTTDGGVTLKVPAVVRKQ